ncbi:hypothetical protein EPD60_03645 [Flaviaesturariibacter flavus]|uniref:Uncharacterized protein n=1 Tax=Flaviaesturariibacter flavus TaxID=2502780 RepID=A0A4R1BMM6_9BACT|nr:hypothetical protein [Flaviaesturariibacter flavus]TCJ18606.1 hypothetical protein EPD60_03645 [Flaviaesturariibacter flavus]
MNLGNRVNISIVATLLLATTTVIGQLPSLGSAVKARKVIHLGHARSGNVREKKTEPEPPLFTLPEDCAEPPVSAQVHIRAGLLGKNDLLVYINTTPGATQLAIAVRKSTAEALGSDAGYKAILDTIRHMRSADYSRVVDAEPAKPRIVLDGVPYRIVTERNGRWQERYAISPSRGSHPVLRAVLEGCFAAYRAAGNRIGLTTCDSFGL